jgi:hypothetical protein
MKSTSVFVCAALLAGLAFACGSEEHYVRRETTIQEAAPTPAPRTVIHSEERTTYP